MSGIILLVILTLWFIFVVKLTVFFISKIALKTQKKWMYPVVFILLFIAPVADEIIGGFQFRALCTPENLLVYDVDKLRGKIVVPRDIPMKTLDKIIPIVVTIGAWEDAGTGELLLTYKIISAKGGWLSHFIGGGTSFFTFNGKCSSKEYYKLFEKLNVTKLEN